MKEKSEPAGVEYTDIEEQVLYGLETIPEDRTIEVSLRDLMYVHKTLYEIIRFFRQSFHYPDLEAVTDFLGNGDRGAFKILADSYSRRLGGILPDDILEGFVDGRFQSPKFPYYYKAGMKPSVKDIVVKEFPEQANDKD